MSSIHVIVPERGYPLSPTADRFCNAVSRTGGEVVFHRVVGNPPLSDDIKALGLCNPTDAIVLAKYRHILESYHGDYVVFLDDDILVQRPSLSALRGARDAKWPVTAFPVYRSFGWDFPHEFGDFSQLKRMGMPQRISRWSRSFFGARWFTALELTDPKNLGGEDSMMELPERMGIAAKNLGIVAMLVDWCRGREVAGGHE